MPQCIVIADDLTGANATGVLLKKKGFDTLTLLHKKLDQSFHLPYCDCLVAQTDSRANEPKEAYERVAAMLLSLKNSDVIHYAKRIDSTLRGNLGSETDAFLDVLGSDYVAVCVPCFPASGRVIIGGHVLVNGVPLRKTEASKDPKCPVHVTNAVALFRSQSKYPTEAIYLDTIHDGVAALGFKIRALKQQGIRNLIIDSMTVEDMEIVADALAMSHISAVSVDPGPFTAILARKLLPRRQGNSRILCAIGSVNGIAAEQVRRLLNILPCASQYMDIAAVLNGGEQRQAEIERLISSLQSQEDSIVVLVGSGIIPEKRISFEPYLKNSDLDAEKLSDRINTAFAEVVLAVVQNDERFKGIYSTGGDITLAIHRAAGTVALRLIEEVVPLAGYGIAIGGRLAGKAFLSKGGMVGDKNAMITCITYLQEHLTNGKEG